MLQPDHARPVAERLVHHLQAGFELVVIEARLDLALVQHGAFGRALELESHLLLAELRVGHFRPQQPEAGQRLLEHGAQVGTVVVRENALEFVTPATHVQRPRIEVFRHPVVRFPAADAQPDMTACTAEQAGG